MDSFNPVLEEKRDIIQNLGPGKYNPKKMSLPNKSIACSSIRNKSTRLPTGRSTAPGPGMYKTLKYSSTGYHNGRQIGEKYKNRPTSSFSRPRTANYKSKKVQLHDTQEKAKHRSRAISAKIGPSPRYNFSGRMISANLNNLDDLQQEL